MISTWLEVLKEKKTERKLLESQYEDWASRRDEKLIHLEDLEIARKIIQKAAKVTQTQLKHRIEKIVSSALASVFSDPYKFKVEFVTRRNVTECDLLFEKDGNLMRPLDSCGYGAADIASLALRVVYWKLDGTSRNVLILDEPTRNLSLHKQPLASLMIKKLSEAGIQFLIVTHNKHLAESADRKFEVDKTKFSSIKKVA